MTAALVILVTLWPSITEVTGICDLLNLVGADQAITNCGGGLMPRIGFPVTQECYGLWSQQFVGASGRDKPYIVRDMVSKKSVYSEVLWGG